MNYKRILFALIAATSWILSYAQAPMSLHVNPNFGFGYPMVTSLRDWYIYPLEPEDGTIQEPIQICDLIVNVNGKNVLNENGLEEFNKTDVITVEYLSFPDEELKSFTFANALYNEGNDAGDMQIDSASKLVPLYQHRVPGMAIVKSSDVDFFDYQTYDFLIEGSDPLVDEELLKQFMTGFLTRRMKRDKENPDVIFRIAKSTDQSFSTTYIPPTQQVVGSTTTINPVYNYLTRTTSYEARQRLNTVQQAARTEVTNVADVYLEVVALDAKKLNDPQQTTPPEIWKMTYSSSDVNDKRTALQRYKDILALCGYPFTNPTPYMVSTPLYIGAYLVPSDDKKQLKVMGVAPYSQAFKLGLQPGDVILKVNGKNEFTRKEMSKNGYSLREEKFLLGDMEIQIAYAADLIFTLDMDPKKETRGLSFKGIEITGLKKNKDNEFLIERNGKKIKLKGQLWYPEYLDMDADTFRSWCIKNNYLKVVKSPE